MKKVGNTRGVFVAGRATLEGFALQPVNYLLGYFANRARVVLPADAPAVAAGVGVFYAPSQPHFFKDNQQ
jgi:hypothetical protein